MITPDTPFREIGNTTREGFISTISRSYRSTSPSPIAKEAGALYDAIAPIGMTLLLASMAWHETKNHTYPDSVRTIPLNTKNAWALTGKGDAGSYGRWAKFSSYVEAGRAWISRLLSSTGPYKDDRTLRDLIMTYAPPGPPDWNDVEKYLEVLCYEMNSMPIQEKVDPVPIEDPYTLILGPTPVPRITYGFLDDVGINSYAFGVGHGTTRSTQHTGDDLSLMKGTPLYAPAPGIVDCVGNAGRSRWGQSCGAYVDEGGGPGNITIFLDGGVKLTLGHCSRAFVKPGDRVIQGQKVGETGVSNGPHLHVETSVEKNGTYWLLEPRQALRLVIGPAPVPDPVDPRANLVPHKIAGSSQPIYLPQGLEFIIALTPVGPNRPGRRMVPTGVTQHETGNPGVGADANMHSRWQDNGTQGHPDGKVGVHFYVDDFRIIQKIPVNETSIHSGDARNGTQNSVELCVHANRNAQKAEENAMALDAALLRDVIGKSALESLYPHRNWSGCPAIINATGRWKWFETEVDARINGFTPVPPERYAEAKPLPFEWDGTDKELNGVTFYALHRVFKAGQNDVPALQYANLNSAKVRRPLPKGEAFEVHWIVKGDDGKWWFVTRFGSRIPADLCEPKITLFGEVMNTFHRLS